MYGVSIHRTVLNYSFKQGVLIPHLVPAFQNKLPTIAYFLNSTFPPLSHLFKNMTCFIQIGLQFALSANFSTQGQPIAPPEPWIHYRANLGLQLCYTMLYYVAIKGKHLLLLVKRLCITCV